MNFKTYTPKDFPEIRCTEVMDSTRFTMEVVRQQLEAEKTGDWGKLKERIEIGMLVDVDNFRRILDLVLPEKNKTSVLEAIKKLEKREDVLYAGPDYFMELCALPAPLPAYYDNQKDALNAISLPSAWDIVVGGGTTFYVGVIDSGIQASHPALSDRVYRDISRDFTVDTADGISGGVTDPYGHGTHVAGVIAANGTSVTGVCWNIQLVSLRVFNSSGSLENKASRVRYAVDYAEGKGISILNYSGRVLSSYTGFNDLSVSLQNYSGLFVCAAGNGTDNNGIGKDNDNAPEYPSNWSRNLSNVISVGAIDNSGNRISLSNFGSTTVSLFAPGKDIYSTIPTGLLYDYKSGTSMAAPHVAGVAALVKSLHPDMTKEELKAVLRSSVDVLLQLTNLCNTNGRINASKAVRHIPIVGSMNIHFNGSQLITVQDTIVGSIHLGKFHLFTNNTWTIVEMGGALSYPIYMEPIDIPNYVIWDPVPKEIRDAISQAGIGKIYPIYLRVYVPLSRYFSNGYQYWYHDIIPEITSSPTVVNQSGRHYIDGSPGSNDKWKIRIRNANGEL